MFTERDDRIVQYIELVKCANSKHIQTIFNISRNVANRRLLELSDRLKKIKKKQNEYGLDLIYYPLNEKPTRHKLLVSEFYSRLINYGGKIIKFETEKLIKNVRSDAYCVYWLNGLYYYFCLEVQISHVKVDIEKYERLSEKVEFMPRIVVISDQKIDYQGELKIVKVDTKFGNFEDIFK